MEKCKFCQAELEEGSTLCAACGKDNAQSEETEVLEETVVAEESAEAMEESVEETKEEGEEETASEEAPAEAEEPAQEPRKKASAGKVAMAVIAMVLLVALLGSLVVSGMDKSRLPQPQETLPTQPMIEATTPPDGDPENETCKGTYTASNDEVLAAKDVVVATAGEYELTLGQLQIYYWQEVSGWLSQYGSYAAYMGLDLALPFDTQMCPALEGRTWQQYFLASALNSWRTYLALDVAAEQAGFELEAQYLEYIEKLPENMEMEAVTGGFGNAQALMEYNVGVGPTVEDYAVFMELYYHGYSYFNHFYTTATATDEEIEAMYAEHEAEYIESGLTKETKTVDVRHILIKPEGETLDDAAWAAAEASAQALLDEWLAGEMTEETFAALATEHTQDLGSQSTGGLYTEVYEGKMVQAFNDWCFDPARQIGDYGIVKTEYGFHVMYYSGDTLLWQNLVRDDVISDKTNKMVDDAVAQLPLTVDYSKILLSLAGYFA